MPGASEPSAVGAGADLSLGPCGPARSLHAASAHVTIEHMFLREVERDGPPVRLLRCPARAGDLRLGAASRRRRLRLVPWGLPGDAGRVRDAARGGRRRSESARPALRRRCPGTDQRRGNRAGRRPVEPETVSDRPSGERRGEELSSSARGPQPQPGASAGDAVPARGRPPLTGRHLELLRALAREPVRDRRGAPPTELDDLVARGLAASMFVGHSGIELRITAAGERVLAEIDAPPPSSVYEVPAGRGGLTAFLAAWAPRVGGGGVPPSPPKIHLPVHPS